LEKIRSALAELEIWDAEPIHQIVKQTAEILDLKLGKVAQPLRVAVTGAAISPPIDITLELIGRERVLKRIELALSYIQQRAESS
jgi:glutamyl-tRNA synthetase